MAKAMEIALSFAQKDLTQIRNSLNSNKRIQKLLFFAYLIHLSRYDEQLFSDDVFRAFEQGCVIESIRNKYKNNYFDFYKEAHEADIELSDKERATVEDTFAIFGKLSPAELSERNHQFGFWKTIYNNSFINNLPQKDLAIVGDSEIKAELSKIKDVLAAYESDLNLEQIELNGYTFYYDPNELTIDSETLEILGCFDDNDDEDAVYTVTKADGRLVIS